MTELVEVVDLDRDRRSVLGAFQLLNSGHVKLSSPSGASPWHVYPLFALTLPQSLHGRNKVIHKDSLSVVVPCEEFLEHVLDRVITPQRLGMLGQIPVFICNINSVKLTNS